MHKKGGPTDCLLWCKSTFSPCVIIDLLKAHRLIDPYRKRYWGFLLLAQPRRLPRVTPLVPWDSLRQLSNSLVETILMVFWRTEAIHGQVRGVQQQGCRRLCCCSDSSRMSWGWQQHYSSRCVTALTAYSSHRSHHDFRATVYMKQILLRSCMRSKLMEG